MQEGSGSLLRVAQDGESLIIGVRELNCDGKDDFFHVADVVATGINACDFTAVDFRDEDYCKLSPTIQASVGEEDICSG